MTKPSRQEILRRCSKPGGMAVGPNGENAAALANMEDDGILRRVSLDGKTYVWVPAK
jgi:hypothetical protein